MICLRKHPVVKIVVNWSLKISRAAGLLFFCWETIFSGIKDGKISMSPGKQGMIPCEGFYHLKPLFRDLNSEALREEIVFKSDETHFKVVTNDVNFLAMHDNGKILFDDLVSGIEGMKIMLLLAWRNV